MLRAETHVSLIGHWPRGGAGRLAAVLSLPLSLLQLPLLLLPLEQFMMRGQAGVYRHPGPHVCGHEGAGRRGLGHLGQAGQQGGRRSGVASQARG